MKRLFFTLSFIIAAGLISTAYSQVSIHANLNLGRSHVYYNQAPAAYAPVVCAPAPAPYYDNGYDRGRVVVEAPVRDIRFHDRYEVRRDFRGREIVEHRDFDRGHEVRSRW